MRLLFIALVIFTLNRVSNKSLQSAIQMSIEHPFELGDAACLRERLDDLIDPDSLRVSGVPTGVRKGEPGCNKHWTGPGGGPWAPPWGVIQGGP